MDHIYIEIEMADWELSILPLNRVIPRAQRSQGLSAERKVVL